MVYENKQLKEKLNDSQAQMLKKTLDRQQFH